MESRSDYKTFAKHWNEGLRAIGEDVLGQKKGRSGRTYTTVQHKSIVPYITVYYARTCWATYAYNVLDIPMDTISQALGHKSGLKVTNFYVKRDCTRVDKANRDMIDRLSKDMAEYAKKHASA
jgi:integrase